MTLTIDLPTELIARIKRVAGASGKPTATVAAEQVETLPEPIALPEPNKRILGLHG